MSTVEARVAEHYTTGALLDRIRAALAEAGIDPDRASPDDLKAVDEFHIGGVRATDALLDQLGIGAATRVLDIGSGIGGTVRHIVGRFGCPTAGVDLTPDFVAAARSLSDMVGGAPALGFHVGSALDLPFGDGAFDVAVMIHVGMNIADKPGLFSEVARVLVPGGRFGVFDVMRGPAPGALDYPIHWADSPDDCFVTAPRAYEDAAAAAGLVPVARHDRTGEAKAFFAAAPITNDPAQVPPLGQHLLSGGLEAAAEKRRNLAACILSDRVIPVEMVFSKPEGVVS